MHIFVNPTCHFGKGREKWEEILPELKQLLSFTFDELPYPESLEILLRKKITAGERIFIAAGGDGTVNLLTNALMKWGGDHRSIILGAIGLGGSNDFHKPFDAFSRIKGIPVRLNWQESVPSDLIRIRYKNSRGHLIIRYSAINCSIGITAQGNAFCNARSILVERIRRTSVEASVIYCALRTLFTYTNIPCKVKVGDERPEEFPISNLGVIKNPHFAGGLCYGTEISQDDGKLGIHLAFGMGKCEVIRTMVDLYKHRFPRNPKTRSWFAPNLTVQCENPVALEIDGEVVRTDYVEFDLLRKYLRICR